MRMQIWSEFDRRHNPPFVAISQVSWAEGNCCEFVVANLWRQHSYRIRIRRKYEPGLNGYKKSLKKSLLYLKDCELVNSVT